MAENLNISAVQIYIPEDANVIVGQSHFIKTVEDIYEAMATAAPCIEFGVAFCEASGDCLIRHDGNNAEMEKLREGIPDILSEMERLDALEAARGE